MNLFTNKEDIKKYLNIEQQPFEDWSKKLLRGFNEETSEPLKQWVDNIKDEKDFRKLEYEDIIKLYYRVFVQDVDIVIDRLVKMGNIEDLKLTYDYNVDVKQGNHWDGTKNFKMTRVIKNMFYTHIYDTELYDSDYRTSILKSISMANKGLISYTFTQPMFIDFMRKGDIVSLIEKSKISLNKLSVFNPYLCTGIFKHFKSKNVLTPTLGWDSYLLGALNTPSVEHYVGIDVIDEVVEKGRMLADLPIFKNKKGGLRKKRKDKKVELYSCPSEKINERYDFINKYKNHFDTIFCSPPYFDLEVYENGAGEQSINNFADYDEWLKGYWEETVKMLSEVMTDDGVMCFVISNYTNCHNNKTYKISEDMRDIASKYFDLESTDAVGWNSFFSINKVEKMTDGNIEDFHIFRKKRVK